MRTHAQSVHEQTLIFTTLLSVRALLIEREEADPQGIVAWKAKNAEKEEKEGNKENTEW